LYDYSGLPTNAAGRMRFDAGDISEWSIPEFVCRPHPGVCNWFYGGGNRITKEIDPITREITAYHIQFFRAPDRPVYMDGRPHPPEWAPHTWAGFSTGTYDGNTLVITTTHLKESYIRANTAVDDLSRVPAASEGADEVRAASWLAALVLLPVALAAQNADLHVMPIRAV